MIKISTIFALGIVVAIMPFLGFSSAWEEFIYKVSGLAIVVLSLLIRRELHEVLRSLHNSIDKKNDTFSEKSPELKEGKN